MESNPIRVAIKEIRYWLLQDWSFADVGAHWDQTEEYDDVNEETYSYFRRFTDGLRLSRDVFPDGAHVLDLCARTGNGTLYFYQHGKVRTAVCADVSKFQGGICRRRLRDGGFDDFSWVPLSDYRLPFADEQFDGILFFETIEHFAQPERLVAELSRVTRPGGIMVLTTPNVLWEPAHALAAITGLHHSEGPHRFIRYNRLNRMVRAAGFDVLQAETSVLVPAGPPALIRFGEWLEARVGKRVMDWFGLRRVLICRKQ
jgi:SAM-dependent methyltransferase